MSLPNSRIIFFQVLDSAQKLQKIVETLQSHFSKNEPILVFVDDEKAAHFLDELLWKLPATSFIPHTLSEEITSDRLVITRGKKNINSAKIAFNLCASPLLIEGPFKIIYELEDLSNPSKKNLSTLRFDTYKQAGLLIEAR